MIARVYKKQGLLGAPFHARTWRNWQTRQTSLTTPRCKNALYEKLSKIRFIFSSAYRMKK